MELAAVVAEALIAYSYAINNLRLLLCLAGFAATRAMMLWCNGIGEMQDVRWEKSVRLMDAGRRFGFWRLFIGWMSDDDFAVKSQREEDLLIWRIKLIYRNGEKVDPIHKESYFSNEEYYIQPINTTIIVDMQQSLKVVKICFFRETDWP